MDGGAPVATWVGDEVTVLLFGCPRSGTSILGELFEHVPGFQFYLEPSMAAVKHLDHNSWEWALKNPIGPQPWTPGLACDVDDLLASVPDPVCVFIVRHPLDTICSLLPGMRVGLGHGPMPDGGESMSPLDRSITAWTWVNGVGFPAVLERQDVHVVKFEDLLMEPIRTCQSVLQYVGSPTPDDVIAPYTSLLSDETGGYEAKHQDKWVTRDHERRIGRWHNQMSPMEKFYCWTRVSDIAERFGYYL